MGEKLKVGRMREKTIEYVEKEKIQQTLGMKRIMENENEKSGCTQRKKESKHTVQLASVR